MGAMRNHCGDKRCCDEKEVTGAHGGFGCTVVVYWGDTQRNVDIETQHSCEKNTTCDHHAPGAPEVWMQS
jgi:hypothetical protein